MSGSREGVNFEREHLIKSPPGGSSVDRDDGRAEVIENSKSALHVIEKKIANESFNGGGGAGAGEEATEETVDDGMLHIFSGPDETVADVEEEDETDKIGIFVMYNVEKKIWGEPTWDILHLFAYAYPEKPDAATRQAAYEFVRSLRHLLPCTNCRANYRRHWKVLDVRNYLHTRTAFIEYVITLNNITNSEIGKPPLDYAAYLNRLTRSVAVEEVDASEADANGEHRPTPGQNKPATLRTTSAGSVPVAAIKTPTVQLQSASKTKLQKAAPKNAPSVATAAAAAEAATTTPQSLGKSKTNNARQTVSDKIQALEPPREPASQSYQDESETETNNGSKTDATAVKRNAESLSLAQKKERIRALHNVDGRRLTTLRRPENAANGAEFDRASKTLLQKNTFLSENENQSTHSSTSSTTQSNVQKKERFSGAGFGSALGGSSGVSVGKIRQAVISSKRKRELAGIDKSPRQQLHKRAQNEKEVFAKTQPEKNSNNAFGRAMRQRNVFSNASSAAAAAAAGSAAVNYGGDGDRTAGKGFSVKRNARGPTASMYGAANNASAIEMYANRAVQTKNKQKRYNVSAPRPCPSCGTLNPIVPSSF